MKLATKFLRVSVMLCLLVWMTHPTVKETAHSPKPELPKIASGNKALKPVDQKKDQQPASNALATTQQQVPELAPALKWLTPYTTAASNRARGKNWISPFTPSVSALKTFVQTGTDLGTPGPTPGDVLRYTVVISNAIGAMDATAVQFTDQIDNNTTLVPNSLMSGPIAVDDSYSTVGNTSISVPAGSGLMTNDVNLNGTPMTVTGIDVTGTMGNVTFNPDGSFTFNPSPGFEGSTTFTYTVNNGFLSATGTVTITVTGMIWYIDDSAAPGGDGRLNTPYNNMNTFNGSSIDGTGDNIFVYAGSYNNSTNTFLLGQQNLIGEGAVGTDLATLAGVTFSVHPPIAPATIPTINGTRPTINQAGNTINMQSQNEVRGVNITNTSGTALQGSGFGSALVRQVSITNTGGVGVNFNNGALDVIIQSVSATNSTNAISVTNTTGSFEITGTGTSDGSGGTLSNISGRGIEIVNATNITLRNMALNSANTSDVGFDGICDEDQNTSCNAAIYLRTVSGVTLNNVDVTSTAEQGINCNSVTNLVLTNCTVTNAGTLSPDINSNQDESAVKVIDLFGTCSFTGCTFSNSGARNMHIRTGSGVLSLTINNCNFSNTNYLVTRFDCFEMRTTGTASATVNITNSTFQRAGSKGIQALAEGNSNFIFNLSNSFVQRLGNPMAGIEVGSNGTSANMNFNINNNTDIESSGEVAVLASTFNTSDFSGRVNNNTNITNTNTTASTFSTIQVLHENNGQALIEINNNTSVASSNIDIPVNFVTLNGNNANARLDVTMDNNNVSNTTNTAAGLEGIVLRAGDNSGGDINTLCGHILNNDLTLPVGYPRAFRVRHFDATLINLQGSGPDISTTFLNKGNTTTNGATNAYGPNTGITFNGICTVPSHAAFAPLDAEVASIVNDDKLHEESVSKETNGNKDVSNKQKTTTTKVKAPKEKEAEPAAPLMIMAGETVTVGAPSGFSLPAGKSITIQFDVTINTPLPAGVCQISNQGSVSGSNFSTILTDDVAGAPINPTVTQLSKHTLGNQVFKDNNKNGIFDGDDAGIVGVVVNLYRDNGTTPGVLDGSDSFVSSTTTAGSGLYAFSNLCSDDYIVQIPSSEFGMGEPLNGLISSPTGAAPDPDNNIDNDDNGQDAISASIASQAITLNYTTSTVEDNTTLDFGFKSPTLVSINDVTLAEGSGGGTTNFTFTVTRDDISEAFDLTVNTQNVTTNGDFTPITGGMISFTAGGSNTASITVVVNADDVVEFNETFNVLISGAPAGVVITDGSGLGTITNDDQATLSINSVANTEGNAGTQTYTFTVSADKAVAIPYTVNVATMNGTATTADNDYVMNSTTLNFAGTANESHTFDVTVNGDLKVEPNETFTVALSSVMAGSLQVVISGPNGTGTGTINNDDSATISIDDVTMNEGNAGTTNFIFTVSLSKPVSTAVTVNFTTANGTANGGGADYNNNSGMVTFPANGAGQTQTITVQVIGDMVGEANETFFVDLSNVVGSPDVSILDAQGVGTILDDDLSFSINDVTLAEGNAGTTNFTFTVTRTSTATAETIDFTTANNTASTGDNDYVLNSGTLNFAIGDNSETITVVVNGDNKVELNETFFVNLSNVSNGSIGDGQGLGTITNDDQATITVNSISNAEGDAGTQNYDFTVTLDNEVDVPLSVDITTSNVSATSGSGDFNANSTTLNFAGTAGETKTFTVVVNGDMIVEPDETFNVILSNLLASSRSVTLGAPGVGTITNDDAATISIDDVTQMEGDAGTTNFVFTVTLSKVVSTAVSVDFTTANGTAGAGDYNTNTNTLTFPANGAGQSQTITVQVIGDVIGEANETFFVNLTNIVGSPSVTFADAQGVGTIQDDDLAFSINDVSIAEGNAGTTNLVFTVTRTSTATAETIDFTTANNTATTGDNDYVLNSGTLNFAIGDDTETITVVVNGDIKVEANETFFVNLSNASNGSIADGQGVGTINNDDAAVVHLQLLDANKLEGNAGTTSFTFTATLNNPVQGGFDLAYTTDDATATTANNDYQDNDGTLSFTGTAGEQKIITVLVNGDTDVEPDETFTVSIEDNGFSNTTVPLNALSTASTVIATIQNDDSDINAGNDTTICASTTMVQLKGTVSGASTGSTWTTSGTGSFIPNANDLNAKYMFSVADTAAGTVTLTLTGNGPSGEFDTRVITIDPASIVNAGPDQTICAADTIYLSATLSGVATQLVWQKNAAFGSFVGSDTSPNAKYVLNATGMALSSLKFGVMSNDPGSNVCQGGLDTVQIFINPKATVDAGPDRRICASQDTIHLNGSIGGAATGATWSGGTGTFSPNAGTLNAVYTFTAADTAANVVKLYLTTNDPTGLCGPAKDSIIITIDPEAIVNAGPDQTVCAADTIYLSATLSGTAQTLVWEKNVAFGTFVGSDTSPNAKFVLNANGMAQSSITFGVMTNDPGSNMCQAGVDTVEIFIDPKATVDAGPDRRICASQDTIHLNGSFGGAATGATWSGGTGTFSPNTTALNAVYTFTAADTAANVVKLYLTTNDPAGLCGPAIDSIIIAIDPEAIVDAGPDQTVCATDTIYLSATLSGTAQTLVWEKNVAFGTFVGPDTSPNAKFVLNANGMAQSSITFGVMTNDPGDNVCQAGVDTVEIFISDPIDASVSIDLDTLCANSSFTATFTETTLPDGSEFTVVVEYTDENGTNSLTFTDVQSGDSQSFQEGVDFDGNLTVNRIIVTPEDPTYCSDTLDGFSVTVVACEATIVDPCVCQNNAQIAPNGTNSNTGTFKDIIRVEGPKDQTWTVASVSGLYEDVAGTDPVDVGDAFTQVSPGVYELVGYHIDAIGYSIAVTNGRGTTLEANNKCFYPNPVFTGLPSVVAPSAAPFQVTGTVADNVAGTGTFILDGVPQAGASPAPTVLTINPGTLAPGEHTLVYSFDAGTAAAKDSLDPGCVQQVRQKFQIAHCGCQDVTVSLNENCQFLLTGNLVSDVNCGGGTVRVMDNDPSNGALIDCAGVWTYGLFDAFGNIICWGKVTAEDKTAPVLVCAPTDFTLDCYDVNYVLNNRLTIGNTNATSSPRPSNSGQQTINNAEGVAGTGDNCQLGLAPPSLVSDNIKNLGYAYFKDNCYNCGCRITLKWSDKVEFYSCEQMKVNGGYYAVISREWTATDCNGMRTSYVQKIKFTRPAVDDFVFNGEGEGKYDRVVEYNSCTPDKSLIKKEDVTPYVCSYFNTSSNPRCLFIDQVECNYSISIKDTEFPICGGKGVKIDRELYVLDWCAGGIVDTFHILIKIGDFQAPTVEYAHGAPFDISTGPMDCTAAIPVSVAGIKTAFGVTIKDNCNLGNISVSVYTKDRYVKGILVYEGPANPICTRMSDEGAELRGDNDAYRLGACKKEDICWDKVEYAVMNGMMVGLPVGKHLMVIDAFDGCYNASTTCFIFEVKDKIAPIMKCDDDLHVTLSNANGYTNGYAQVSAADIDEGSWDNCKLAWIAVRRNVPDGCAASFIAKGYDTNGNGKLDALPADGDVTKADGFDLNGDGDIADFGETFIIKGGKLMTPLLDYVEFFCCDLTERVTVELWGGDIYGNTNYCWMDLLIEDKVAPTCLAPWDVTIYCDDKNIGSIDSKVASAAAFGDVTIPSGNDCAALDTTYTTEKKLKCGAGYIDRIWTLTKQTAKGPISVTCKQRIHILPVHEYNICFPKDVSTDCKTPIIDTVITDELGCDILAVNVHDKRYDASDDECYKIFRTYSVINWCTYDDRCGDPLEQTNISVIDRAVFGNYGKAPIYVLVRDRENNQRDGIEEFYISKDLIHNNADDIRFKPYYCEVAGEFYHSFIYTQIIKVYDDTRPEVTGTRDTFCTSPTACTANITKVVTLKDNCTDKVELETQFLMIAPFQTLEAGKMILYSTPRWSTKDLGNGQFEIKVSNLPEGTHDLIVVGRDECGNLSLPTRIPFVVKDCKAPAPICINGLSVDLMPDGNGGGMMTVWASDFVASKIYDCNGQGPETKDGLKLITKYSVNRVQQPVDPNQTSISVNCADLELGFILVELHAWDEAGNHDFCVTFIEVQDNNKVCPAPVDKVKIAGTIATEGSGNLQGVSVTLSGSGTQSDMTGTDGNYEFVNISKGGDFTVTPQLDKNHLNGVSTFDLVLIQKHILGVQALNSPYKMIAADANNSKSISTLDMIQIRKLILNIDTHFANNTSWRFVDASYRFPNPTNPWSTSFPEVVSVNDLVTNVRANFVAIKVGDVNASAIVNGATNAEIRTSEDFKLKTQEQNLKSGNEYKVSFTAEDLKNIQGYQFALNLDQSKVELVDIEYGVAKAENFGVFKNEGIITTSWNSKYEPGALFTLVLRAKADAKLSSTLSLNRLVSPEAYDQQNENLGIALNFEGIQATESYELRQNTPNPFSDETVIGFTLPKALKGTLTVRDVKGATIYKVEGNYAKGNNQVTLKKEQLGASGVLYYTLETTDFTATKKMVILE